MTTADQAKADLQKGIDYNGYNVNQDWRLLEEVQDPGTTGGYFKSNTYNVYYNSKDPTQNFSVGRGDVSLFDQLQKLAGRAGIRQKGMFNGDVSAIDPTIINSPSKIQAQMLAEAAKTAKSGDIGPTYTAPKSYVAPTSNTTSGNRAPTAGSAEDIAKYGPNYGGGTSGADPNIDIPQNKYSTKTGQLNPAYDPNLKPQGNAPTGPTGIMTPANQGFALTGNNLKIGSAGDDVKKLQQYLQGIGLYQGKIDGIFGPQTQASVKQFQSTHGLTADGIVGPKTVSALSAVQSGARPPANSQASYKAPDDPTNQFNTQTGQPNPKYNPNAKGTTGTTGLGYNTGDPAQDALLKELQDFIKAQQEAGLKINPNLQFDQATLDKFLETAKKQVHPFYQQQIDSIKADVLQAAPEILKSYGNDIAGAESAFQNNLGAARENYADSGLAFSGQRAKGELGMQDNLNRSLQDLNQGYGDKLYALGRGAEQQIGSDNVNYDLGSLRNYSASLSGNGGFSLGNLTTPYQSGGYKIGSLQNDEAAAIEARNQALKKTASENVVNGRSYQDLFK